jgi:hypothetical protein
MCPVKSQNAYSDFRVEGLGFRHKIHLVTLLFRLPILSPTSLVKVPLNIKHTNYASTSLLT